MSAGFLPELPMLLVRRAVEEALAEDWGRAGDITSNATIAPGTKASCVFKSREAGILSGIDLAETALKIAGPELQFEALLKDGDVLKAGSVVAQVEGDARAILSAERVALNYLMRMCGIATYTNQFAEKIAHTDAKICCTRKTAPGHRALEKYAVKCGGGSNHRFGLDDAVLIKDNHVAVAGGVSNAIERARAFAGHLTQIEIEVDTLEQFSEALACRPDVIMLDNMSPEQMAKAVRENKDAEHPVRLEASGNVAMDTVLVIAETGVDYISTSKITMAAPPLDIGLDIAIDS